MRKKARNVNGDFRSTPEDRELLTSLDFHPSREENSLQPPSPKRASPVFGGMVCTSHRFVVAPFLPARKFSSLSSPTHARRARQRPAESRASRFTSLKASRQRDVCGDPTLCSTALSTKPPDRRVWTHRTGEAGPTVGVLSSSSTRPVRHIGCGKARVKAGNLHRIHLPVTQP